MTESSAVPVETNHRVSTGPFFFTAGTTGVLLLHGYSGSPAELRAMGEALAAAEYTACGPRLAGHGGTPDQLKGVRWQEWARSAEDGLHQVRQRCNRVFIAGFSMGALLAVHLAAQHQVAGLVLMAPAQRLMGNAQLRLTGVLKYVMPWFYPLKRANFADQTVRSMVLERVPDVDFDDPAVVERIRNEARIPLDSLYEIIRLQDRAWEVLPHITVPSLLMQGRHDKTVDPRSVELVAGRIGSPNKHIRWFERSGHMLPNESERSAVWSAAAEWMAQV